MRLKLPKRAQKYLVEALGGSLLGDRASSAGQDNELFGFRPLTQGVRNKTRDLTMLSHKEMVDIALLLYHSNPLAEWLVDMPISLIVGQELGYNVAINPEQANLTPEDAKAKTQEIRETLDKFWYHTAHNVSEKAPEYARTFLVTGHLVLPVTAVNPVNGIPQLDLIDAAQIKDVVGLNGSSLVPGLVAFTPANDLEQRAHGMLVLQQGEDGSLLPQDPGPPGQRNVLTAAFPLPPEVELKWEGLYFRYHKLLNSLRGLSYLMPVADWLDAFDQFAWTVLHRAKLRNAILWHLKAQNLTGKPLQDEVDRLTKSVLTPGTVYGSNQEITVEALCAKLEGQDAVDLGRMILTHILGAKSLPESWYSSGSDTNRSTASEQTDVAYKALLALQTRFRGIFRTMLWMAYDSAQAKQPAVLPKRTTSPWLALEPNMPVVQERDMSRLAAAAGQLVSGLSQGIEDRLISRRTSRRTFLDVLGQITGGAYEVDVEEAQIQTEEKERQKEEATRMEAEAAAARQRLQDGLDDEGGDIPPAPRSSPMREGAPAAMEVHHHTHLPQVTVDARSEISVPPAAVTVQPAPVTVVPGQAPVVLHEQHTHVAPTPAAPTIVHADVHMPETMKVAITDVPATEQEVQRGKDGKQITKTLTRQVKEGE